jgi:hypothetical protein
MIKLMRSAQARCWIGTLLLVICFGWGCRSPESHDTFASVIIRGRSFVEIQQATKEVFEKHQYAKADVPGQTDLVFEKEGTKMNTLVYGGWAGDAVWVRVKIFVESWGDNNNDHLLHCDAYMVEDHGDGLLEKEHKLTSLRRGPYQSILNEVKAALTSSAEMR